MINSKFETRDELNHQWISTAVSFVVNSWINAALIGILKQTLLRNYFSKTRNEPSIRECKSSNKRAKKQPVNSSYQIVLHGLSIKRLKLFFFFFFLKILSGEIVLDAFHQECLHLYSKWNHLSVSSIAEMRPKK